MPQLNLATWFSMYSFTGLLILISVIGIGRLLSSFYIITEIRNN